MKLLAEERREFEPSDVGLMDVSMVRSPVLGSIVKVFRVTE